MRRTSWVALAAVVALTATAGCAVDDGDTPGSGSPTSPPASAAPQTPEPTVPPESLPPRGQPSRPSPAPGQPPPATTGDVPGSYLDAVIADAAQRAGVAPEQVRVDRDQAVQWSDGSLGCPEPGAVYIQVIIDGYWVEVTAAGRSYDYRLDDQGNFRLCDQPLRSPPGVIDR